MKPLGTSKLFQDRVADLPSPSGDGTASRRSLGASAERIQPTFRGGLTKEKSPGFPAGALLIS